MEKYKELHEILEADPRSHMFHIFDEAMGDFRERDISDIHSRLDQIELNEGVPEAIRDHFLTSKHLVLYSWFVYRFIPIAEFHAIASLEFALKIKTGKSRWGLKRLLQHAVKEGWVRDNDFRIHREKIESRKEHAERLKVMLNIEMQPGVPKEGEYTSILVESLPYLRNVYAHGSNTIAPQGYLTLIICAEFINKLFKA